MKILEVRAFDGRNIYAHKKCIRIYLDLEGYSNISSKEIEGFNDNLVKIIPELNQHRCGIDENGGFVKRLNEGTYLAHICEHVTIAIQNLVGIDASYGKAREVHGEKYLIVFEYEYKNTALEAGNIAVELINSLIKQKNFNFIKRIKDLKDILLKEQLGPSTVALCKEAKKRGISVTKIGEFSMFQFGYGSGSKIIEATVCSDTSAVSVDISCDKLLTKEILDIQCLPIAKGGKIQNTLDLLLKAENIGYPVVLKPRFGNQGKGVIVNISNEKELLKSYNSLCKEYVDIIIEKCINGCDYRVCVVNNKVIAVSQRIPPSILGDGINTIKKLINELNKEELRGFGHEKPLTKIKIDSEIVDCIQKQGYDINSIIPKGIKIALRRNANLSTGGISLDCTDNICEENIDICIRTAEAIGLNICGIDICCKDISIPLKDQGAIIEVNAAPGIRMHHHPYEGESRNVAGAILDMMFDTEYKDIPLVSVTGTNGKTTTTRLIAFTLSLAGYKVGMTTTGGIFINNKCIDKGDTTGPDSALTVLSNKEINAAVLETARGGIIRRGLAYDLADVGVITNITDDHIGIDEISNMDQLANVKSLVVEAIKKDGYAVINADDYMSVSLISNIHSKLILFSKDKENKFLKENLNNGGYVVYSDNGHLYVQKGENITPLVREKDIAITLKGKLKYNVENAMAACSALIGLNIEYSKIKKGLINFYGNEQQNPGRFNIYNLNGISVILDYGHNIEGYKAVLEGAEKIKHNRLIGIIGVPGDRNNTNVLEVGKIAGKYFDYIYIKEDLDKRGRKNGEIAELLSQGVLDSGFDTKNKEIILNEVDALEKAINDSLPGDIIIIFFEKYEPLLKLVKNNIDEDINDASII